MLPPWEHTDSDLTATDFEMLVRDWIEDSGQALKSLEVKHNQKIEAHDSTYQIDVLARFEALGAEFVVLIECKKHTSAIPRTYVQLLNDNIRSTGAHKGMLFATTGFQSGAIQYAKEHGIALVKIDDGKASYETRSLGKTDEPPPWVDLPQFMGWSIEGGEEGRIGVKAIDFRKEAFLDVVQKSSNKALQRTSR